MKPQPQGSFLGTVAELRSKSTGNYLSTLGTWRDIGKEIGRATSCKRGLGLGVWIRLGNRGQITA